MMGLGILLQEARLEQGLTIEEMAQRTKIRPQFLAAIEEENFQALPGEAYIKPFVRSYAKALGIEERIESEFSTQTEISKELATSIRERRERNRRARRMRVWIRLGLVFIVLVVVAFLIYKFMFA